MKLKTILFAVLVLLVSSSAISQAASTKKKKQSVQTTASELKSDRKQTSSGWNKITTNQPELCDCAYKVDGGAITLKVRNLSSVKPVRLVYSVKCQAKNPSGKWEPYETYPPEGLRMTVKKQDEIEKNIWTNGEAVKDVVFAVSVSEAE